MSTVKGPKGYSPTTIILIVVLLGAVVGASRLVTPPPPAPPVEVKSDPQVLQAKQAQLESMKEKEASRAKADIQGHMNSAAAIPRVEDPHAAEIDNSYFVHHKPGEEGLKQVDTEMKVQTAKFEEYKRKVAATTAKDKTQLKQIMPPMPPNVAPAH